MSRPLDWPRNVWEWNELGVRDNVEARPRLGPSPNPSPERFALFAGWLMDRVYGWHAHLATFATREEALNAAAPYRVDGCWFQVVDLELGRIVEQEPRR